MYGKIGTNALIVTFFVDFEKVSAKHEFVGSKRVQPQQGHIMKRETFNKDTFDSLHVVKKTNKMIILPFEKATYETIIADKTQFKAYLMEQYAKHPELFPASFGMGWRLNGLLPESTKHPHVRIRRIETICDQETWQIRPSFMMPYNTIETATAAKILFLSHFGVPDWGLAYVFEKDAMFIHRLVTLPGRYNMVGTTVKAPDNLPNDLAADEKHTRCCGAKVYAATTVANDCFLGASISSTASESDLTRAYEQFKTEAIATNPDYRPETVNTDGWHATSNAWKTIFPGITVILCFLHAMLKIKTASRKATDALYRLIADKAWDAYRAPNKATFSQRIRRLREWSTHALSDNALKTALLKLCSKRASFTNAYDCEHCLRTSNMIDRLLNRLDRRLFAAKYFHGKLSSAEKTLRAFCLVCNFFPYAPETVKKYNETTSAFERLNGFSYHDCWLQNLLIASSKQDIYIFQQKTLQ